MHTKSPAPANIQAAGISVIKISVPLSQGELPRPEHAPSALQHHSPSQQTGLSPAWNEERTRRATYAERRLRRYL